VIDTCKSCGALRTQNVCFICGDFKVGVAAQRSGVYDLKSFERLGGYLSFTRSPLRMAFVWLVAVPTLFTSVFVAYALVSTFAKSQAWLLLVVGWAFAAVIYLSPTFIAHGRRRRNWRLVLILNLIPFFVMPMIGMWVACTSDRAARAADLAAAQGQ